MPSQAVTKKCAQNALEQLLKEAKAAEETRNTPFEYLRGSDATEEVKRQWFASPSNIQQTAQKHGVDAKSIDQAHLIIAKPVRYLTTTFKPGYIERPFPDTILVIIALDRLTHPNGLPRQDPTQPVVLEQGQALSLSGDSSQTFDGQGGGIAYLMVLRKVRS